MRIINGCLWSPFYIMVKDFGKLEFQELLKLLNIQRYNYRLVKNKLEIGGESLDVVFVIRRGDWIQIMDNWGYQLWHDKQIKDAIHRLGMSYELFQFSIGDIDFNYDFTYYKGGKLIRRYAIEANSPKKEVVLEDLGMPLIGESEKGKLEEPFDKIIPIAESIGISFKHILEDIEVFSKNEKDVNEQN